MISGHSNESPISNFFSIKKKRIPILFFRNLLIAFLIWLIGGWPTIVFAMPQGGQIVGGSGTITEPTATSMQVDQNTHNMVINWNSFNIGSNESVNFTQPSSSATVLNRVIGADPSLLLGSLTANGNVFITNGSGVYFGHGSRVDTHGLIATTMGISDQDFLNETYNFAQDLDNPLSSVINEGNISTASYVGLLAPAVENRGTIVTASLGSIDLASGTAATMDFTGDGLIQFEVTQAVSGTVLDKDGNELEDRVSNKGLLQADGGQIRMSAKDAGDVIRHVVNMEGMIKANSVVEKNGKVFLMGGDSGIVNVSGTIDTSGDDAGEKGGAVNVQADTLLHSGTILADGETEGGAVTVNAKKIQQSGTIQAEGVNGSGGEIDIDFVDNYIATQASKLSATGNDADGGSISVNGGATGRLFTSGEIDASSSNGIGGSLELLGEEVLLVAARLDASGDNGGGSIYVGGDFQGQGTVPLSNSTTVTGATTINADANQNGNGGEVVVWSEGDTSFFGTVTARGGSVSGNGGTIEVSGKGNLAIGGTTDASAANGVKGTLLLDPKNIVVDDSSGGLPFFDLTDPNANGASYGDTIATLANGNIVVLDIDDDFGASAAGAVYLYDGATGALINTVTGTSANDQIGSGQGITELTGGDFVISSPNWDNGGTADAGAVTVISGTLGTTVTGAGTTVTTSNSLHGTTASDQVGIGAVVALSTGNFGVISAFWDGSVVNAGAATLVSGTTGQAIADSSFVVSTSNSVHGTTANDQIGNNSLIALTNGNFVVTSQTWDGAAVDVGAATLVDGTTGRALADSSFVVSTSNSIHGTTASDQVGRGNITELTGGNYVVISQDWDNGGTANVGAVTLVDASTGAAFTGGSYTVSTTNSLHGSTASDAVGDQGVYALTNGNYVVASEFWDGVATDTGAATWGNGTTGIVGAVTSSNSIVGSTSGDRIARHITVLTNGNFSIRSEFWKGVVTDGGAVTWGDGTTGHTLNGIFEAVSATNSLVGTTASDHAGLHGIQALTNGNYVVASATWDSPSDVDAGAVTWMNGTTGLTTTGGIGAITTSNSLHGTTVNDQAGLGGITALTNGNYVVGSNMWDGPVTDSGALTLVNGSGANAGAALADSLFVISTSNSLYGTTASDQVGVGTSRELSNGNYVFSSINWDNGGTTDAGAVTLIDGSTGRGLLDGSFVVSANNSLVGTSAGAGTVRLETDSTNNSIVAQFQDNTTNRIRVAPLNDPTFALASGDTYTIHSGFITNTLDGGTAVILQASNDITINSAIIANNSGGAGGDLTLQAGRSVLINANITTDDGNLIIIANDLLANGVIDAQRDSGAAAITMGAATTLNTGSGNLTITLRDGAGKTNSTSGLITIETLTSTGTVAISGTNGVLFNQSLSGLGTMTVEGDSNNSSDGTDSITIAAGLSIASTGSITLDATTGGITLAGGATFSATSGMTVNDTLSISTGTAIFSSATSINDLALSGGALQADGDVSVTNGFAWSGSADISGSETFTTGTNVVGTIGAITATVSVVQWDNDGTITWTTNNALNFTVSGILNNNVGADFNIVNNGTANITGGGTFNNKGTMAISGVAANTNILPAFHNTGTVNVNASDLVLDTAGVDTGSYVVASGALLNFSNNSGTRDLQSGSSVTGAGDVTFEQAGGTRSIAGTYNITGTTTLSSGTNNFTGSSVTGLGTLNVSGGTADFSTGNDLSLTTMALASGAIVQGSDNIIITSTLTWTGGDFDGTGTLTTNVGATATLGNTATNLNRVWNNNGTLSWTSGSNPAFNINSTLNNNSGANFIIANTGTSSIGGTGTVNNAGTMSSTGTSNTTFSTPIFNNTGTVSITGTGNLTLNSGVTFDNDGQVNVVAGDLTVAGTGADTGDYAVSSGHTVTFNNTRSYASTTDFTGSGGVLWNGGTQTLNTSSFASTLAFTVSGGTVDLNNTSTVSDLTVSSGGILDVNGSAIVLTVSSSFLWSGASTISGTGTFFTDTGVTGTMTNVGQKNLTVTTWNNAGNITWDQNGGQAFDIASGTTFNNSGTFNLSASNAASTVSGSGIFNNSGAITTGNATEQQIDTVFNNTGQVNVVTGDLVVNNTGVDTGNYAVSSSRALTFTSSGTRTLDGVSFTGLGTAVFSTGTFTMSNSLTFEDIDVTMTQTIGGSGTLNLQASAGNSIGLGAANCGGTCTNTFTTTELGQFTSPTNVVIGGAGDVFIETIVIGDFSNVTGNISFNTTAGNITFANDSMAFFNDATKLTTLSAAAGTVTVPGTLAGTIGVGDTTNNCGSSCAFIITDAKLATITANNLTIGDSGSGAMVVENVTAANTANITNLNLVSGSTMDFDNAASSFANSLTVSAAGNITQSVGVTVGGSSSFTNSAGDITMNYALNNLGTGLTVNTIGNIAVVTASTLTDLNVTVDPGGTDTYSITATGLTFTVTDSGSDVVVTSVSQSGLNFSLTTSTGNLSLGDLAIDTGAGNVSLVSTLGNINEANNVGTANITTTGSVSLSGETGVGNASTFDVASTTNLTIDTDNSFNVDTGSTVLTDLSIIVDPATSSTYILTSSGVTLSLASSSTDIDTFVLSSTAALNFSLTTDSGLLSTSGAMNVGAGSFSLTTNGNITLAMTISNTITAGSLVLDANGQQSDVIISANINITDGSVAITADDSVVLLPSADIMATGAGNVTVESNTDTLDGSSLDDLVMDDGSVIDAGSGTISLTSTGTGAGNITVSELKTTSSSNSAITVTSISTIFDAGDTLSTTNFSAVNGGVVLVAASSIGNAPATSLEFDVASLDATNSGNSLHANLLSDISITNLTINTQANFIGSGNITQTGAIVVGALTASLTSGAITLTNTSNNVTSVSFSATGDVSYVDTDDFDVNTTNSVIGVSTSGGSIDLSTTGSISATQDITVSAGTGTVAVTADSDKDGVGDLTIGASDSVSSNNGAITLQGADIDLSLTTTAMGVDSGTGLTTLNFTKDTTGDGTNTSKITASALTVNVTGDLMINGVTSAELATIGSGSGLLTLYASNDLIFQFSASDHGGAVIAEADNDIKVKADVTSGGDFTAEADHDKNGTGDFTLDLGSTVTSSAGNIDVTAVAITQDGTFSASGTTTLTETGANTEPVVVVPDQGIPPDFTSTFVTNALPAGC
jgi:trimeric autotransporter adhesin